MKSTKLYITPFEATLLLREDLRNKIVDFGGPCRIIAPVMPPRRRVSIEEFEADRKAR